MMPTAGEQPVGVLRLVHDIDVFAARRSMRSCALVAGFDVVAAAELVIVVSELAWNVLKHGRGGSIGLFRVRDWSRGVGLRVDATDLGPPFLDFEMALIDGHDDRGPIDPAQLYRRGGLGGGLGAVSRLTDELTLICPAGEGKVVRATRYRDRRARAIGPHTIGERRP